MKIGGHTYSKNPVPFVSAVINPRRRKGKKRTRNPSRKKGMHLIRKPTRNPGKRRKSSAAKPAEKLATAAPTRVSIAKSPKRRKSSRRRTVTKKNPPKISTSLPMSKSKRRSGKRRRSRNPMSRRGASRRSSRRSSPRRRNPSGRRRRRYSRNPMPGFVREIFGPDMLSLAGGVVISSVGTTMIMNKLVSANPTTGQRMFDLPLVDYSMLANPQTAGTFYSKNAWALAGYKLVLGGAAGWLLRNQSPRLARGLLIGSVATAISDVLKNTGVLSPTGTLALTRGTGRQFPAPRGAGYLPGTSTRYTGLAQQFLAANSVPQPRGMGARVGPGTMATMERQSEGAFRGAN